MPMFTPFKLERFFAQYEFSAPYLLCSSDCESIPIADLLALEHGSQDRLNAFRLGYTESRGAPMLREAIASLYAGIGRPNIIVHAGAEEAILNLFMAVLESGDKVVVNSPCYQSLMEIPRALGCDVKAWECREDGKRWRLDPDELERLCSGGVKLIALNAPHNPTGALPDQDEFMAVIDVARKHGAILLVDEVYRRLEHDVSRRLPSVCGAYENGIALDVLSKHAGLAGLRIGWLATKREDILDAVAVVKDYNSICVSGPSELLAEIAIRNLDTLVARNRGIIAANLALLDAFFAARPSFVSWTRPEGGSVAFPRFADGRSAQELCQRIVAESGVLLLPGSCYGDYPESFRLGYGRATMPESLARLEAWLDGSCP